MISSIHEPEKAKEKTNLNKTDFGTSSSEKNEHYRLMLLTSKANEKAFLSKKRRRVLKINKNLTIPLINNTVNKKEYENKKINIISSIDINNNNFCVSNIETDKKLSVSVVTEKKNPETKRRLMKKNCKLKKIYKPKIINYISKNNITIMNDCNFKITDNRIFYNTDNNNNFDISNFTRQYCDNLNKEHKFNNKINASDPELIKKTGNLISNLDKKNSNLFLNNTNNDNLFYSNNSNNNLIYFNDSQLLNFLINANKNFTNVFEILKANKLLLDESNKGILAKFMLEIFKKEEFCLVNNSFSNLSDIITNVLYVDSLTMQFNNIFQQIVDSVNK